MAMTKSNMCSDLFKTCTACMRTGRPPASGAEFHTDVLNIAGNTAIGCCVIKNWHGRNFIIDFPELMKENS